MFQFVDFGFLRLSGIKPSYYDVWIKKGTFFTLRDSHWCFVFTELVMQGKSNFISAHHT